VDEERAVKIGETVELVGVPQIHDGMLMLCGEGSTKAQAFPPQVIWPAQSVKVRGRAFDLSTATEMRIVAEQVRTTGIVRKVSRQPGTGMKVEISSPAGYVIARLPWNADDSSIKRWLNNEAAFTGVIVCRADKRLLPEDADATIFVPSPTYWQPHPDALNAVFAKPTVTAAQLGRSAPINTSNERQHLAGRITAIHPPSTLFLRTEDGSVEISSRQAPQFHVGEKISVAGWLLNHQGRTIVTDGVCRSHGNTDTVPPVQVRSLDEANSAGHGELVHISGVVRDVYRDRMQGRLLVVLGDGTACAVRWEPPVTSEGLTRASINSFMEFTGICEIAKAAKAADQGASFTLRPRTNADLHVVRPAPWWNRQRMSNALWVLVILAGIAIPGAVFLRWKLWRQEGKIREIERASASASERQRIAREFHDNLQQELFSTSLHVETVREAAETAPQKLPVLLDEISSMLRHCQVEARNFIWDLRSDDEFREGIAPPLRSWLAMRQRLIPHTRLDFEMEGEDRSLPSDTCLQVLRITQEAVNNALAHAQATQVKVRLKQAPRSLEVRVEDDGRGFNTSGAPAAAEGHYGLSMLRERAQRIHARIDLRSEKDHGTSLRLVVPHPSTGS
jgi:signal transduction histidine kinase